MATVTKSIKASSGDYTTPASWESDLDNTTPYDPGDVALGYLHDEVYSVSASLVLNGGATIGLIAVDLTADPTQLHDGTAGTGPRMVYSTGIADGISGVPVADAGLLLGAFEVDGNGQAGSVESMITNEAAAGGRTSIAFQLLVHGGRTSTPGWDAIGGSARDMLVMNCIVYDMASTADNRQCYGISLDSDLATGGCLNNTVYGITADGTGTARGIDLVTNSANVRCRNNIAMGVASGSGTATDFVYAGSSGSITNNLSEDASADDQGTSHQVSKTPSNQFVSVGSDFHLKAGADAIGTGVDLANTPAGVRLDIDNYDRDAGGVVWDIGADQSVSTVKIPVFMNQYRQRWN